MIINSIKEKIPNLVGSQGSEFTILILGKREKIPFGFRSEKISNCTTTSSSNLYRVTMCEYDMETSHNNLGSVGRFKKRIDINLRTSDNKIL